MITAGFLLLFNFRSFDDEKIIEKKIPKFLSFFIGGFIGSKVALKISPNLIRLIFGTFMLFVAFKMIVSGMAFFGENDD